MKRDQSWPSVAPKEQSLPQNGLKMVPVYSPHATCSLKLGRVISVVQLDVAGALEMFHRPINVLNSLARQRIKYPVALAVETAEAQ